MERKPRLGLGPAPSSGEPNHTRARRASPRPSVLPLPGLRLFPHIHAPLTPLLRVAVSEVAPGPGVSGLRVLANQTLLRPLAWESPPSALCPIRLCPAPAAPPPRLCPAGLLRPRTAPPRPASRRGWPRRSAATPVPANMALRVVRSVRDLLCTLRAVRSPAAPCPLRPWQLGAGAVRTLRTRPALLSGKRGGQVGGCSLPAWAACPGPSWTRRTPGPRS